MVLTVRMLVRMVLSAPDLPVWQRVVWGPPNQSDVMDRDELSEIHFEWARNMRKVVGDKALPRITVSVCGAFACKTRHFAFFAFQGLGMCRERGGGDAECLRVAITLGIQGL